MGGQSLGPRDEQETYVQEKAEILDPDKTTKQSSVSGHFLAPHLRLHLHYPRWIRKNTAYSLFANLTKIEIPYPPLIIQN